MAVDLLRRHLQTLVADPGQWQTLIADDMVWELAYAPALGHPARLSGRGEVMRHVAWFSERWKTAAFSTPGITRLPIPKARPSK